MILDGNNLSHDDVISALSVQSQDQKNAKQKQASCKLEATKERIQKLTDKLIKADKDEKNTSYSSKDKNSDWTKAYGYWSNWEDVEELMEEKNKNEKNLLDQVKNVNSDMGHYHDHSIERTMFAKPENEKYSYCERHRAIGNYLYSEGLIPKAAEQYQIALSYYEYCFPDSGEMQAELDSVRQVCLCNISLCYYRMGLLREAVISATQVITENPIHAKAYFRRAQAYRALDEYSNASSDLKIAYSLTPLDSDIINEIKILQHQKQCSLKNEEIMAKTMLSQIIHVAPEIKGVNTNIMNNSSIAREFTSLFDIFMPLEPRSNYNECFKK